MTPEELAAIRERAAASQRWWNRGHPNSVCERDRAALLTLIDAIRAEVQAIEDLDDPEPVGTLRRIVGPR